MGELGDFCEGWFLGSKFLSTWLIGSGLRRERGGAFDWAFQIMQTFPANSEF
jgi:hypothetical protein